MPLHELHSHFLAVPGFAPQVATADTPIVSGVIDLLDAESVEFLVLTGALADADAAFAVTMTAGDAVDSVAAPTAITDSAAADPACMLGTLAEASFTFAADLVVRRIGYRPAKGNGKRFVRLTVTPTGNTGNAPLACIVLKHTRNWPPVA
jgi:hypothetical protein